MQTKIKSEILGLKNMIEDFFSRSNYDEPTMMKISTLFSNIPESREKNVLQSWYKRKLEKSDIRTRSYSPSSTLPSATATNKSRVFRDPFLA